MLALKWFPPCFRFRELESLRLSSKPSTVVVCAAKGPRPRYARVWKTNRRIGTISKSAKLLQCVKGLSNVKEEVYGALDSFIAWELEFPLITVKKAIKSLEEQKEWKRVIQVTKWMLSKGQGRTMGTYAILLNALAEDERLEEAEELWNKLFSENLESTPRNLFTKMLSIFYHRQMYDKMFEIFADMEELGIRPNISIVTMVGKVFQNLGMWDKYERLNRKYPPPKWEYRYIRGRRVKIRAKDVHKPGDRVDRRPYQDEKSLPGPKQEFERSEASTDSDGVEPEEVDLVQDSHELLEAQSLHGTNEQVERSESGSDIDGVELEEVDLVQDSNGLFEGAQSFHGSKEQLERSKASFDSDGFELEEEDPVEDSNELLKGADAEVTSTDRDGF